jgi:hypothetical protein
MVNEDPENTTDKDGMMVGFKRGCQTLMHRPHFG